MKRSISGIKPTNKLHIGNYCGVIPNILELKNLGYETILFAPDLHALTSNNRKEILEDSKEIIKFFISCLGYNFDFFIQSDFYHSTYLSWIFACETSVGSLNRMTQFKSIEDKNSINSGYLYYPLLMAADILLLDVELVPVGLDQTQHIELARNIGENFNKKYKELFKIPKAYYSSVPKIFDLQNPNRKMSKTIPKDKLNLREKDAYKGVIFFQDKDEEIEYKILKAKSDGLKMPDNIESIKETRKEIYNLCSLYKIVSNKSFKEIQEEFKEKNISEFKRSLINQTVNFIEPIRSKMNSISDREVEKVLLKSKKKIYNLMEQKIQKVKSLIL